MIKKLDLRENIEIIPIKGSCHDYCLAKSSVLIKINELVDAVNKLQKNATISEMENVESHQENVQDEFAEQRRWIGKLCWFWNKNDKHCGVLTTIFDNNKHGEGDQTEEYPFQRDSIGCWQHCEPVKPDDDIIYKGGNNE